MTIMVCLHKGKRLAKPVSFGFSSCCLCQLHMHTFMSQLVCAPSFCLQGMKGTRFEMNVQELKRKI